MFVAQEQTGLLEPGTVVELTTPPAPRRRWSVFRVSVRSLLMLVLVAGCGMGWVTYVVRTGQVQRQAVAAIYHAGGWVLYDTDWDARQATSSWKLSRPRWLVDRLGVDYCANVVFINLHDRGTDTMLAQVSRLTHLKQLHRPGPAVTDGGLAHLRQLTELQFLSLDRTQVTDAGLAQLSSLNGLRWLKLGRTKVTDAGVRELQRSLPHLQALR
jgi:hypothetical protein